jgi:hypothetical protein
MSLLNFNEFNLNEGVRKDGESYVFDFKNDLDSDLMSLKFTNRSSRNMTRGNTIYTYYYCYEFENDKDRELLKNIKIFSDIIDTNHSELFIKKAIQGLDHRHKLNQFDCIIHPKSSSLLLSKFAKYCNDKSGASVLIPDTFIKVEKSGINFDYEKINAISNEGTKKQIYKAIEKIMSTNDPFKMKEIYAPYRKFIKDFLIVSTEDKRVNNLIKGKTVLLIDDYRTTGTTLKEMMNMLIDLEAKRVVICVIIDVK